MADTYEYLGSGVLLPFRRDGKDDFANGVGLDVIKTSLTSIFGTLRSGPANEGELPYNQELGSLLRLLRHRNINDPTTQELATHYVLESILVNEPRVRAKAVGFDSRPSENKLVLRLTYDVVSRDTTGTNVLLSDVEQEIDL